MLDAYCPILGVVMEPCRQVEVVALCTDDVARRSAIRCFVTYAGAQATVRVMTDHGVREVTIRDASGIAFVAGVLDIMFPPESPRALA